MSVNKPNSGTSVLTAQDVANYLLAFSNETGDAITNLKLQKMLYYVQAWYLANHNEPLFSEDFEAWIHGPVIPSLYHQYKVFGGSPIESDLKEVDLKNNIDSEKLNFIKEVIEVYMPYGGYKLELMTHNEQPWIEARGQLEPDQHCSEIIEKESMRIFYGSKIGH